MQNSESRNLAEQRREQDGIVYFDRGDVAGADGAVWSRLAVQTHFVGRRESSVELVRRYIGPLYRPGDVVAFGAKVMAMCKDTVRERKDVQPGFFANLLSRHAGINSTGVGMHEPYKMQLVIDICGLPRVLVASGVSAVTRPFGMKGLFYKICGKGVAGIDGFYYRSSFDIYHDLALINPDNPDALCDEIYDALGIPVVLMDANDIDQNQLGKSRDFPLADGQIQDALGDNPFGQGDELTPLILIRRAGQEEAPQGA